MIQAPEPQWKRLGAQVEGPGDAVWGVTPPGREREREGVKWRCKHGCRSGSNLHISTGYCTSTLGLVRPVATVVLPVTLPPCWNAASVLTLVLEISGAAWNLGGSSWRRGNTVNDWTWFCSKKTFLSHPRERREEMSNKHYCYCYSLCNWCFWKKIGYSSDFQPTPNPSRL